MVWYTLAGRFSRIFENISHPDTHTEIHTYTENSYHAVHNTSQSVLLPYWSLLPHRVLLPCSLWLQNITPLHLYNTIWYDILLRVVFHGFWKIFHTQTPIYIYTHPQSTVTIQCSTLISLYCYHTDRCYHALFVDLRMLTPLHLYITTW